MWKSEIISQRRKLSSPYFSAEKWNKSLHLAIFIHFFKHVSIPDSSLHLMGRPLGLPHHREQQLAVIHAALRLLETAQRAPTIETFTP